MTEARPLLASHAAAALGFVDWSTPLSTYLSCRDGRPWAEDPEEPHAGVRLKPALRAWAGEALDMRFEAQREKFLGIGRTAHLAVPVDGLTADRRAALILRTPKDASRYELVDDYGQVRHQMPLDVRIRAELTAQLMKLDEVWVAVLLGGNLVLLSYSTSGEFGKKLLAVLGIFWTAVRNGTPPAAKVGDEELLRSLFPSTSGQTKKFDSLSPAHQKAVLDWAAAQRERTTAKKTEDELRPSVLEAIGNASGISSFPIDCPVSSVSCDVRDPYPNNATWNAVAHELLAKLSPKAQKRIVDKHTPQVGTRVLRPFFATKTARGPVSPEPPSEAKGAA